ETWLPSVLAHFSRNSQTPKQPTEYLQIYERHEREVRDFFASQPQRLLVLDIEKADWEPVCRFLGRRRPVFRVFPHRNRTDMRGKLHLQKVLSYEVGEVMRGVAQLVRPPVRWISSRGRQCARG